MAEGPYGVGVLGFEQGGRNAPVHPRRREQPSVAESVRLSAFAAALITLTRSRPQSGCAGQHVPTWLIRSEERQPGWGQESRPIGNGDNRGQGRGSRPWIWSRLTQDDSDGWNSLAHTAWGDEGDGGGDGRLD